MKPFRTPALAPVTAVATGFASNVTGATWALSANVSGDSMAHLVTIHNDSANDHSGKTALVTGLNANGVPQTETIILPTAGATVTGAKYFSQVDSVVPSATIGADTMDIGWSAASVSPTYPVDGRSNASAFVAVDVSGTINFTLQETMDNVFQVAADSVLWVTNTAAGAVDIDGLLTQSAQAFRLLVNTVTNGATIQAHVAQGGNVGA